MNRFVVQHRNNIRDYALTIGIVFFVAMVGWGAIAFGTWVGELTAERDQLRIELQGTNAAFKSAFNIASEEDKRKEAERQLYIAKWKRDNPDLVRIIEKKWKA